MRVISFNANGIRAAARKGFFDWLATADADVVCIQETKAQAWQLEADPTFWPEGYHCRYVDAERKGYSGVAIYSREKPKSVTTEMGLAEFDAEGRYCAFELSDLTVASLYLPSGSAGDHRQASKERFLEAFLPMLDEFRRQDRSLILCGDWNIAHREIDLKNWRNNRKSSGFLPHERAWLDRVFDDLGFVDAHRRLKPDEAEYTWWSNRANAWQNNVGWRIDYQIVTPDLEPRLAQVEVYRGEKFSDHAPLIIDYR
ncbi:MAG: exodeoxyribonuclease III [Halothiobacillaceae bacterium]|nr:exodeoxyribonuclease III [Halothiobacillaceae bacterium]